MAAIGLTAIVLMVGCFLLALMTHGGLPVGASVAASLEDEKRFDALNTEVVQLYNAGKYQEAEVRAKQALALAESLFGPDHPSTATNLNNLA